MHRPIRIPKLNPMIVVSCDSEFYWGRPVQYGKCVFLHFGGIQRLA